MVDWADIAAYARRIGEAFGPRRVILFGSYAYGRPTDDSDVDLLVVMDHDAEPYRQAVAIDERLGRPFRTDLMVRSPAALRERLRLGDPFLTEAVGRGILLHEGTGSRVGREGRGHWNTAGREVRARKSPNYDAACFHAQQCAEKYLKAKLTADASVTVPKTHDLVELRDIVVKSEPFAETLRPGLRLLTRSAVEVRCPGIAADRRQAKEAVAIARDTRDLLRSLLGLS